MSKEGRFDSSSSRETTVSREARDTSPTQEMCVGRSPLSRWIVLGIGTLGAALGWESDLIKSARADQPPIVSPHKPERPGSKGAPTAPEQRREKESAYKILFDDTIKARGIKRPVHIVISSKPFTVLGIDVSDFSIGYIVQHTIGTIQKIEQSQKNRPASRVPYDVLVSLEGRKYNVKGVDSEVDKEKITSAILAATHDMFGTIVPPEIAKQEPRLIVNFPTSGEHFDDLYEDVSRDNRVVVNIVESLASELSGKCTIRTEDGRDEYRAAWVTQELNTGFMNRPNQVTIEDKSQKAVDYTAQRTAVFVVLEKARQDYGNDILTNLQAIVPAEFLHTLAGPTDDRQAKQALRVLARATPQAIESALDRVNTRHEAAVHAAIAAWFKVYAARTHLSFSLKLIEKGHPEAHPVMRSAPPTLAGARQILLRYVQHPEQIDKLIEKK